jgi:N-methylhydantoinase A/oxoprolinase/acetone carboxylase beta subunit
MTLCKLQAPQLDINTVAAGGGSCLQFTRSPSIYSLY